MSFLTELSLKKASVTLMIAAILTAAGVYAAMHINQEITPDIDFPIITVITRYQGADAQQVASQISAPLEQSIASVPGLKSLQSVSSEGMSILVAQFDYGHNMKATEQDISRGVDGVRLPSDAQRPEVMRININQTMPVVYLSLGGDMETSELEQIAQQELIPRISAIEDVQKVDLIGGVTNQMEVVLDQDKMRELGISFQDVAGALAASNLSTQSGVMGADGTLPVRTTSQLHSAEDIEKLSVGSSQEAGQPSRPILLGTIATVRVASTSSGTVSRTNGKPSVGIMVTKAQQGNTVEVADAVLSTVRDVQRSLGGRVDIETVMDQSTFIKDSVQGLTREASIGAVVAVIVIWLFLMSFRSALVTAVSIPLSVVVALVVLYFQGFTLNMLTLGGLAIAVGRVIDDSIVVLENIFRHAREGDDLDVAVRRGTREVTTAIFGSTMTTIAVFLPLAFIGGIAGVFFRPFALTVAIALLASLAIALTVTPVLARAFIGRHQLGRSRASSGPTVIQRVYSPVLGWALGHRLWTLGIAAALFLGSLALVPLIPTTFLPQFGEKRLDITLSAAPGSDSTDMMNAALEAERIISALPDVKLYQTSVSSGGGESSISALRSAIMGQGSGGATLIAELDSGADQDALSDTARERLEKVPGVVASVSAGHNEMSGLQVSLKGADYDSVRIAALKVLEALQATPGVRDLSSGASVSRKELVIDVDPEKALAAGTTAQQVAQQVQDLTTTRRVTQVSLDSGEVLDVVLRAGSASPGAEAMRALPVGTSGTPLGSIAAVDVIQAPSQVTRLDQKPAATINGTITGNVGKVNSDVKKRVNALDLPPGVEVEYGGVLQQFHEGFNSLYLGILAAILIVYVVMVVVMGSLLTPFVIMFSLPLATIGVLGALAVTNRALGLPSLLGVLMLVGIVVTNGIVLIDFVGQLRARGYGVKEALIEGGRLRARPVLMTAVATIVALVPLALGFTEGAIIAAELATVVIGGLLTATLLTLVVVPMVYSLVESIRAGFQRRFGADRPRG